MELFDNSNPNQIIITNTVNQGFGTIELYFRTTDSTKPSVIDLKNGANWLFQFAITSGNFYYWTGANHFVQAINNNQWYHLRIDLECTGGTYLGLAQYRFRFYIDEGSVQGDYAYFSNQAQLGVVAFRSQTVALGYYFYVDAIGYSWDASYDIGDNINLEQEIEYYYEQHHKKKLSSKMTKKTIRGVIDV